MNGKIQFKSKISVRFLYHNFQIFPTDFIMNVQNHLSSSEIQLKNNFITNSVVNTDRIQQPKIFSKDNFSLNEFNNRNSILNPSQLQASKTYQSKVEQNILKKSNNSKSLNNRQKNHQTIQQLMQLQRKWIIKQNEIRDYVQFLDKTIEDKEIRIERLEKENCQLKEKNYSIENEKNHLQLQSKKMKKLLQSTSNLTKKHMKDVGLMVLFHQEIEKERTQQKNQNHLVIENNTVDLKINHKLTPPSSSPSQKKLSFTSKVNPISYTFQHQVPNKALASENKESTLFIKMREENFYQCPKKWSQDSKSIEKVFEKKQRLVRDTMKTDHTYEPRNVRGSMIIKNNNNKQKTDQKAELSITIEKVSNNKPTIYRSAQTITFSNQQNDSNRKQLNGKQFHSQNQIFSESNTPIQAKQQKKEEIFGEDQRNENRKNSKIQNLQYSLTSSFVSDISYGQFRELKRCNFQSITISPSIVEKPKQNKQVQLKTEITQIEQQQKKDKNVQHLAHYSFGNISLSPLKRQVANYGSVQQQLNNIHHTQINQLTEPRKQSLSNKKENYEQFITVHQSKENLNKSSKTKHSINNRTCHVNIQSSSVKKKIIQGQSVKQSNPQSTGQQKCPQIHQQIYSLYYSPEIKSSLIEQKSHNCQSQSQKAQNNQINNSSPSTVKEKSFIISNTNVKKGQFAPTQADKYSTSAKTTNDNKIFEDYIRYSQQKARLFFKKQCPETKSASLKQKFYGDNFYLERSANTSQEQVCHQPFKKFKYRTESDLDSKKETQKTMINLDKLMFENQMLKSYNNTLEKQARKFSKKEKLIEIFNSQNVSVLHKINKKSIS